MRANQRLLQRYTGNSGPGKLDWIGLRPERRTAMIEVDQTTAIEGLGLEGDRRCKGSKGSSRQVTLISAEHLPLIGRFLGKSAPLPQQLRRNLVISSININLLRHQRFSIGEALFEGTALCHPCRRMEEVLGEGGFSAMYGYGGLCAKILRSGDIRIGDEIKLVPIPEQSDPQAALF